MTSRIEPDFMTGVREADVSVHSTPSEAPTREPAPADSGPTIGSWLRGHWIFIVVVVLVILLIWIGITASRRVARRDADPPTPAPVPAPKQAPAASEEAEHMSDHEKLVKEVDDDELEAFSAPASTNTAPEPDAPIAPESAAVDEQGSFDLDERVEVLDDLPTDDASGYNDDSFDL